MRRIALLLLFAACSAFGQEIAVSDPTFENPTVPAAVAVTASGDRFITAWGYGSIGGDFAPVTTGVFASITDLGGRLVRGPVALSLTGSVPAIADGTNRSVIAWLDGNSAYTATIDRDGDVSAPTPLLTKPLLGEPVSIVWNGSRFLVLYRLYPGGVIGFLLDENGRPTSGALAISDWTAAATTDGNSFLAYAYRTVDKDHPEKGGAIWGTRIDSSGAMRPSVQTTAILPSLPSFAAAGRTLFWENGGTLHRVVVDGSGAALTDTIIATDTQQLKKAVETGSGTLLSFFGFASPSSLMLVERDGRVIARQTVPFNFDFSVIGQTALLVTHGLRGYPAKVAAAIQIGEAIDLGHTAVAQFFPQVAANGSLLLAAWFEASTSQVFAARMNPIARKHFDGRGLLIDSQAYGTAPAVAPLGDGWVIAYLEVSSGVAHLWIRRVFPDGTLDSARTLVSTTAQPFAPRIASDGNQALLVWTENTYKVRGARISRDGSILDPAFLQISDADTLPLQFGPEVTIDGDNYLVAWQGQRTAPIQIHLSDVHVTRSGVILDPPASMTMIFAYRVAGNAIAGTSGYDVFVYPFGQAPIGLGMRSFGDIEKFGGVFLAVGADPLGLWAAEIADDRVENRFTIALPAAASQVSLAETRIGVAAAYIRATGDEAYGGGRRAYVLPINGQRRRSVRAGR